MTLQHEALQLVEQLQNGKMSSTAYDTSWFVRLRENGEVKYPQALAWLLTNQHADGSWGGAFETFHDRLISTLAAVNALTIVDKAANVGQIHRGLTYIRVNADKLRTDDYETIGFELLFPMLLDEAEVLQLDVPKEAFAHVYAIRDEKLKLLPTEWVYQPRNPMAHNLEYLAAELDLQKAQKLVDANGTVANSPSATAFLAMQQKNPEIEKYLALVMQESLDGGVCNVKPFEVFEIAWVYYNLLLAGLRVDGMAQGVNRLQYAWSNTGVGISAHGLMPDADDSALAMNVMGQLGAPMSHAFLQGYRTERGYLCFPFERNPSVSTNIHILDALAEDRSEEASDIKQHVLQFLRQTRIDNQYWKDKWHVSPYYTTAHAMIALRSLDATLAEEARIWITSTQRSDGSWGVFGGTVEETAYCVQALLLSDPGQTGERADIEGAIRYLRANRKQLNHPELWIGKGLYAPIHVIEASALSALLLYENVRGELK